MKKSRMFQKLILPASLLLLIGGITLRLTQPDTISYHGMLGFSIFLICLALGNSGISYESSQTETSE
ncbi:MAG: hypothetical protein R3C61_28715 [Bacteroidia bacterium]